MDEYLANRMRIFDENYKIILDRLNEAAIKSGRTLNDVTLLAATKTVEVEVINHAFESGLTVMGENRVQEFLSKEPFLNEKMHRQLIGTLQRNKVRQIVGKVELIQSVDSIKLAKEIDRQSKMNDLTSDVLIEINIAGEESKSGLNPEILPEFLDEISQFSNIKVKGLMTLGPISENAQKKSEIFDKMQKLFIDNSVKKVDNITMDILSMGMSSDYDIAVLHGANMVRVGSALFGARNYN